MKPTRPSQNRPSYVAAATPVLNATAEIPTGRPGRWIEPWYLAYAILGALASGWAVILVPLAVVAARRR